MEEKILTILQTENKSFDEVELKCLLEIDEIKDIKEMYQILNKLEQETIIYKSKKDKYVLFENSHLKKGIISINKKGYGFLLQAEEDVYVKQENLNQASDGDLVIVEIINKSGKKEEGRVLKVIKKTTSILIGEIVFINGQKQIKKDNNYYLVTEDIGSALGHLVIFEKDENNQVTITKIIGHKNDPGIEILKIVCQRNLKYEFDEETLNELVTIPDEVTLEETKERRDLTKQVSFTIDGETAKDLDDAISIFKLENNNYLLQVHIADVSHYIKDSSSLDKEAQERGLSCYLLDRVIPMLPPKLSNGICSLFPNTKRLAVTCEMEYNTQGELINYDIFESVIESKIKMTYEIVNDILDNKKEYLEYQPYLNEISLMNELSEILRKKIIKRGYLEFANTEVQIDLDDNNKPIKISLREQKTAEKIIENFMIATNEVIANHIFKMDYPFLYRVHELPNEEKVANYITLLNKLGYNIDVRKNKYSSHDIQAIIEQIKDKNEFPILSDLLLRSMAKAKYLNHNLGHFGLASDCYTHFTAPIRRYSDLTIHRLLKKYIFNKNLTKEQYLSIEGNLSIIGDLISNKEQKILECEREVIDLKMAEYMEDKIGEEYKGIISNVTSFGMFVRLDNQVEGLVHINNLKDDYYYYNEDNLTLIGKRLKKKYQIGDVVKIRVLQVDKEKKEIDFEIIGG